jgi:hypothetical protein
MWKAGQFAKELVTQWGTLVTSGALIGGLGIWQGLGHPVRPSVYWAVALVGFLVACYRAWLSENELRLDSQQKLETIERAKPRIKLREPGAVFLENVSQNYGQAIFSSVPFLKIGFVNDPVGSYPSAKANDVRATIDFYRAVDDVHLLSIDGRWADSDQPSAISPLASKSHLLRTTFGIGEAHSLDIAYRDAQTGRYFAWNNDNYRYPYFRYDHHLLEGNEFRVAIRLQGDWVDERFSFTFSTCEAGFTLEKECQNVELAETKR